MTESSKAQQAIVPAHPGYVVVYRQDTGFELGEDVIAWLIDTTVLETPSGPQTVSYTTPICVDGSPPDNWAGVRQPDGQVVIFQQATYSNIDEASQDLLKQLSK